MFSFAFIVLGFSIFIYLLWLHWVLVVACGIFALALDSQLQHPGSSSPTTRIKPGPPTLGMWVLATEPPGKSLGLFFKLKVGKGTNYFGSPSLALPVLGISHVWSLLIPKFSRMRKLRFIEIGQDPVTELGFKTKCPQILYSSFTIWYCYIKSYGI